MNAHTSVSPYGKLVEPATLEIQRMLPGPAERVWRYLTESDLRRQWLAAGDMEQRAGAPFEFTWRNDELTDSPGNRPEGSSSVHTMASRIIAIDPPHKLVFAWGQNGDGEVTITLEPRGERVLLTLIHRRLPEGDMRLNIRAGWHAHLDVLVSRLDGARMEPFWDHWLRLKNEYAKRAD